jgi:DNA-binding protein YbaB
MTSLHDDLVQAMTEVRQARTALADIQTGALTADATVRSRNRIVSATVGAQGQLKALTLHGESYRKMPAAEFAALIQDTIEQARQKCAQDMMDLLHQTMPGSLASFDPTAPLGEDFEELFTSMVLDRAPGLSDAEVREIRQSWAGLR